MSQNNYRGNNRSSYNNRSRGDRPAPVFTEMLKMDMWADCPGSQKRSRLSWGTMDGNPRVSVFLNHPDHEGGAGIMAVGFYVESFVNTIREVIKILEKGKRGTGIECTVFADIRDDNGKITGKEKKGTYYAGIDKEGMAYQTVMQDDKPRPVFRFMGSPNFTIRVRDESAASGDEGRLLSVDSNREEFSQLCALGYFNGLLTGMAPALGANKPPRTPGGDAPQTQEQQGGSKPAKNTDFEDIGF